MEEEVVARATPASTELVPLAANLRWLPKAPLTRETPTAAERQLSDETGSLARKV